MPLFLRRFETSCGSLWLVLHMLHMLAPRTWTSMRRSKGVGIIYLKQRLEPRKCVNSLRVWWRHSYTKNSQCMSVQSLKKAIADKVLSRKKTAPHQYPKWEIQLKGLNVSKRGENRIQLVRHLACLFPTPNPFQSPYKTNTREPWHCAKVKHYTYEMLKAWIKYDKMVIPRRSESSLPTSVDSALVTESVAESHRQSIYWGLRPCAC